MSFLFVLYLSASPFVRAADIKEYDQDALELASVIQECPLEIIHAMNHASRINKATYESVPASKAEKEKKIWIITVQRSGGPNSPPPRAAATVTITLIGTPNPPIPDVPPMSWKTECSLRFL